MTELRRAKGSRGCACKAPAASVRCSDCCHAEFLLQEPGSTVLVAGATGGVGQLLTAKLLDVSG
jgi:NADPH:quinone reductase-like Zn-dependent oxidoreductase